MSLYFGDLKIPSVNYTTVIANIALETKTVTPSKNSQTITPSNGNQGFSSVTINPIPNEYIIPTNTLQISTSGEHNVTQYAKVNVIFPSYTLENRIVTPTTSQQSITPSTGYDGLGQVTINAISTQTKTVTSNGTYTPDSGKFFSSFTVNVPTGATINSEEITISPSETEQIITPSNGHNAIVQVTVNPISSTYVGSEIPRNSQNSLTASGATISVPAGYYSTQATKSVATMNLPTTLANSATSGYTKVIIIDKATSIRYINIPAGYHSKNEYYQISAVANGIVTAPSTISGTTAIVSTGTNTLTLTKTINVTPNVTTAGYITSGTAGNSSVSLTASVTTKAAATITPNTSNQTIASGTYLTGTQTIAGDSNLVASNIISGKSIFGVNGNVVINKYYTGTSAPASSLGSNGDIYLQE